MPADSGFLRLGSVNKKNGGLLPALKHNKRELPEKGHIDTTRTHLNYSLTQPSTAQEVNRRANITLAENDIIKVRSNAVMAIEIIFSLSASWLNRDSAAYFADCMAWTIATIDGELLSFDIHLDESAPHAHALIMPLLDGKLQGREIMGSKGNLYKLKKDFMQRVGRRHGLRDAKRLSQTDKAALSKKVVDELSKDSALKSIVWAVISDHIKRDPQAYAQVLNITQQTTRKVTKSFTAIMTSKGKGIEKPP